MPCDYKKYDPSWKKVIRPAILERANNCCEECGVGNGWLISRDEKRELLKELLDGAVYKYGEDGKIVKATEVSWHLSDWRSEHICRIVLTVAHLNHDVTDNRLENLKALCQKHHLAHDKNNHMKNAKETNRKKKGLQNLF